MCVTIGCWRMAGGWLLPSLCANHLTDRVTSFEGSFVSFLAVSWTVAMEVMQI